MKSHNPEQQWYTLKEAANYLRTSTRSLRRAMNAGQLRQNKTRGRYLLRKNWLDAFACGLGGRLTPSKKRELEQLTQ